jgi:Zn-dependent metalloprotease
MLYALIYGFNIIMFKLIKVINCQNYILRRRIMKKSLLIPILTLLLLSELVTPAVAQKKGQVTGSSRAALLQNLLGPVQGNVPGSSSRIKLNDDGFVRHMGAAPGNSFPTNGIKDPDTRARAFLNQWTNLFHGESTRSGYKTLKIKDKKDRFYVRLHQLYADLPVFGAQTIVQLDAAMNVTYVNSDIMQDFTPLEIGKVGLSPTISSDAAQFLAVEQVVAAGNQGKATEAELMIYCPTVVGAGGSTQLVWQTIVEGITGSLLKEMVLINAHTGTVSFRYSLIHNVKNREVFDSTNTDADPGTLVRTEGGAVSSVSDANQAYDYFGDTYDFYWKEHGRDSIDNAGMTLSGTVRFCNPGFDCPWLNAGWDGSRMYFGNGFTAADDVIAHELTHGVTQYESELIYANQSGAINESLSDVWGEFVDLTNSGGTDTDDVRWQIAEDIPFYGPFRDMKDPTVFNPYFPRQPDRMLSPYYFCGDDGVPTESDDYGGVHTNSGVNNKLSYLLTDGDSFNGQTITGMGISKVADLYYECQTNLLTSSSDYSDLYSALTQAAINLGFPQTERDNVEAACQAVELDADVCGGISLDDYNLSIWDISDTSYDGEISYTLIQDSKGKLTGWGRISSYALDVELEIKGKVKGSNDAVMVNYTIKGNGYQQGYQYTSTQKSSLEINKNSLTMVGTTKFKACLKGWGCEKDTYYTSVPLPSGMTGKASLLIDAEPNLTGAKFEGTGELTLSNREKYPLYFKGKYNSKKGETKYSLKGVADSIKGIKFKLTIDEGSGDATGIKAKALGQKLIY